MKVVISKNKNVNCNYSVAVSEKDTYKLISDIPDIIKKILKEKNINYLENNDIKDIVIDLDNTDNDNIVVKICVIYYENYYKVS